MRNILYILNEFVFVLFMTAGWIVAMIGLFLFAVFGTLGLENMSIQLGLPADPELAGLAMIALFVCGFICLNQVTGGALYRAMGWSHEK